MRVCHIKKLSVYLTGSFLAIYVFFSLYLHSLENQNFSNHDFQGRFMPNMYIKTKIDDKGMSCSREQTNFVFIKCMKCATETMATIFRRFGYVRNLNFALPLKSNLYFGWPFPIEKSDVRPSKSEYNILMEHSIYNKTVMRALMPNNTRYIGMIRNPWQHFKSTYNYFSIGKIANVINNSISEYMDNIKHYETIYSGPENNIARWCIPDGFSLTRNLLSHCLGMPLGFPEGRQDISNDSVTVKQYIKHLDKDFDLIMIADYFEESLILLKRTMCWGFKDIIYHLSNVGTYSYKTLPPTGRTYELHRNWSHVDYALYDHFNETFWMKVAAEGPGFRDELEHFRLIQLIIERFCFVENMGNRPDSYITIPGSKFGSRFNVTGQDCSLMNHYILPMLWTNYFIREGVEREQLPEVKDRPKPARGCSINV